MRERRLPADGRDEEGPISVLMEELLTYTQGQVLCTYTDYRDLAGQDLTGWPRHRAAI